MRNQDDEIATSGVSAESKPSFAVALCSYNGTKFIHDQLDSILQSSWGCSELVMVDDASSDATVATAHRVLSTWSGRAIIEVNRANMGSSRSFERAMRMTTQPFVFLSDQDDLWLPTKTARMLDQFIRRPDLLLLHSDARIVDEGGEPLGYTLFRALEISPHERRRIREGAAFHTFIRRNLATGATVAFRRSLLEAALPLPDEWVHDEWLATIASCIGTVDYIDEPLIDYRQHADNQIGARRLTLFEKIQKAFDKPDDYYQRHLRRTTALLGRLIELGDQVKPGLVQAVREKLVHLGVRSSLPSSHLARVKPIISEFRSGAYQRYSTGFNSVARDLLHRS